jgi:hypothetical protein
VLVELGNPSPVVCVVDAGGHRHEPLDTGGAPSVCYINIPDGEAADGSELYGFDGSADVNEIARALLNAYDGVTHLPGQEALLALVHPAGILGHHFGAPPSWVRADVPEFAEFAARFLDVPTIDFGDMSIEDTHFTRFGPPGVVPGASLDMSGNITQQGRDLWARALGGGVVGLTGTGTVAPTATTISLDGQGAPGSTSAWNGQRVYCGGVWGIAQSNTNVAPPVVTIDRWYAPATPGGAAGATPAAGAYVVLDGNPPAWFMGLTANATAPASPSTATSLTGEIVTASGGLVRKICPFAHTASANTYTLTPVFTANASDALPVTVAKIGVFASMVVAATLVMLFETLLSATATLSTSGDQLTVTETVTGT